MCLCVCLWLPACCCRTRLSSVSVRRRKAARRRAGERASDRAAICTRRSGGSSSSRRDTDSTDRQQELCQERAMLVRGRNGAAERCYGPLSMRLDADAAIQRRAPAACLSPLYTRLTGYGGGLRLQPDGLPHRRSACSSCSARAALATSVTRWLAPAHMLACWPRVPLALAPEGSQFVEQILHR